MNKYDAVKKDNLIEKINTYCLDNEIKLDLLKNEWDTFCNVVTVYLSEIGKENEYEKFYLLLLIKQLLIPFIFHLLLFPTLIFIHYYHHFGHFTDMVLPQMK